jgi:hypothetical protein
MKKIEDYATATIQDSTKTFLKLSFEKYVQNKN